MLIVNVLLLVERKSEWFRKMMFQFFASELAKKEL
jgi:hypothetical protein